MVATLPASAINVTLIILAHPNPPKQLPAYCPYFHPQPGRPPINHDGSACLCLSYGRLHLWNICWSASSEHGFLSVVAAIGNVNRRGLRVRRKDSGRLERPCVNKNSFGVAWCNSLLVLSDITAGSSRTLKNYWNLWWH